MAITHIDTRELTREPLNIKVLRVESPNLFWVRVLNSEENRRFRRKLLNWWMSHRLERLILWPHGRYYRAPVAMNTGGGWERGELVQEINEDRWVVSLRDSGVEIEADCRQLYQLPKEFHGRRWEAIPCSLENLVPTNVTMEWAPSEVQLMKNLCEKKVGRMRIRGSTPNGVGAFVRLVLQQPAGDVDTEKLLIDNNCGNCWPRRGATRRRIYRGLEPLPQWRKNLLDDAS